MKNSIILGTVLLSALLISSCKKDSSSTTTKPSLSGLSMNSAPAYVAIGDEFSFQADVKSLVASDGSTPTVGLYWQVNGVAKKDTLTKDISKSNPAFQYKIDTLGTYNVYCYAFAGADYYNTSTSATFTAVDPKTVIAGRKITSAQPEVVTKDNAVWNMLNVNDNSCGLSYRESPVLDAPAGRMYNFTEALTICASGYHLPTLAEFKSAFGETDGSILAGKMMADATFQKEKMWEYFPAVQITNEYSFDAIPLGYVDMTDAFSTYNHYGEYACYWTADSTDDGKMGKFIYLYANNEKALEGTGDKNSLYMTVRCVKD